jgi:hypothetical protein
MDNGASAYGWSLEVDLCIIAYVRLRTSHRGHDHFCSGDDLARTVPEFAVIGGDGDETDIRIVGVIPPSFVRFLPKAPLSSCGRSTRPHGRKS